MVTPTALGAQHLRATMVAFRDALRDHQQALNRLNVYPVPDGDTGTNMALTLESVVQELAGPNGDADMAGVCRAMAHGSLMGARGNSGVILSQLLRGIAEGIGPKAEAGPFDVAAALVTDGRRRTMAAAYVRIVGQLQNPLERDGHVRRAGIGQIGAAD